MAIANLIQLVSTQPNVTASNTETLDDWQYTKPNPTLAGNGALVCVAYPSGATPVITDDKGNTWPASGAAGTITADAGAGNMALQVFVLQTAATGTQTFKVGFGGNPQQPVRVWIAELYNVTGTIKGSNKATAVNAAGVVSPGAFTPTQDNCLIFSFMCNSNTAGGTNPTLIASAAGYDLQDADISWNTGAGTPAASQAFLQGTAASTTASFTLTGSGTDTYNVLAFALSTGSQGTPKPAGIHIDRVLYFSTNQNPASYKLQIPSSGNLGVLVTPIDLSGTGTLTTIDSDSVTWTAKGSAGSPLVRFRPNYTPSPTRTVTLSGFGTTLQNFMCRYLDVSGADPSPFDVVANFPSTGTSNSNSVAHAPDITPTTANGLVIGIMQNGIGPTIGITSPAAVFAEPLYDVAQFVGGIVATTLTVASTTWGTIVASASGAGDIRGSTVTLGTTVQSGTGPTYTIQPSQSVTVGTTINQHSSDVSNVNWGNGLAIFYNPTANVALNFTWTLANQPGNSATATAIAFKAAPTTVVEAGAVHDVAFPGLQLGTPVSRLRSGLEDTTPAPGPVGLPQGELSVGLPTTLRLGTPVSRLRSGLEDTTPSPGPTGLPQGEQRIQFPSLRLGTPLSRLRGIYSDVPPPATTTGVLNLFGASASSGIVDTTGSPGFMNENGVSASSAFFSLSGGISLTGASASAGLVPAAGGISASGSSASSAAISSAGGIYAFGASASISIFPLSGGIGAVGTASAAGSLQLSGGIGLFGVSGSSGTFSTAGSPGILSLNGVSASAAVYSLLGLSAGSVFLTGVSASSASLVITGISIVPPDYFPVPDLTGVHWYTASKNLMLAGLNQTKAPVKVNSNRLPPGYVLYQDPPAGTFIAPGTNVVLTVVTEYLDGATIGIYSPYTNKLI